MNTKIVIYNGGTESYYGCSKPDVLVKGARYLVIAEEDRNWQTDYTLNGIPGKFNSTWFDEVPGYLAVSNHIPVQGEPLRKFYRLEGENWTYVKHTSTVTYIELLSSNIYKVFTKNTLYIVQVTKS